MIYKPLKIRKQRKVIMPLGFLLICCLGVTLGEAHSGGSGWRRTAVRKIDAVVGGQTLLNGQCLCSTVKTSVSKIACGPVTGFIQAADMCFHYTGKMKNCGESTQYSIGYLSEAYVDGRYIRKASQALCRPVGNYSSTTATEKPVPQRPTTKRPSRPHSNKHSRHSSRYSGKSQSGNDGDNEFPIAGISMFWPLACYAKDRQSEYNENILDETLGLFDIDGDDKVSAGEILAFPFYGDLKLSHFEDLVKYFDVDKDDALDLSEFSVMMGQGCKTPWKTD